MINKILEEYKQRLEERFETLFPKENGRFSAASDAARYSLLSGGKRIRPVILMEFYKLCGGASAGALDFAAALEMIHTYSLIHDDLPCMDNDDMRRGKPSCHKAFGEANALLAGDALLTAAFSAASSADGIPPENAVKGISVLAHMAGINGMIGGQVTDLALEKEPSFADEKSLIGMYLKKTGCLLEAASVIGCVLAGADEAVLRKASEYARNLGLAFQIIDDILDISADEKVLGKPIGSDAKNGKITFVTLRGIEGAREAAAEYTEKAKSALYGIDGDKSVLSELTDYLLDRNY